MADPITDESGGLTATERGWLDAWAKRCDADRALMRHEGYVEMFEDILRHRLALRQPPGSSSGGDPR
jgi:hypothetical protein